MTIKRTTKPEDQTTFLDDESQEVEFVNPNPIDDVKMIVLQKKKPDRQDSFFYPSSLKIAEYNYKGWTIAVATSGDTRVIDLETKDEIYDIHGRKSNIEDYWNKYDDKILRTDRFEWHNNNWFHVYAVSPESSYEAEDGKYIDLDIVEHDYDSAISALDDVLRTLMEKGELP